MTRHLTIDDIHRWRHGEVAPDEVLAIGGHLSSCRECAQAAMQNRDVVEAAHALCDDVESAEPARWNWLPAIAAAAVIALVAGALWMRRSMTRPIDQPAPVIRRTPSPVTPRSEYEPEEWAALVRRAREGSPIGIPNVLTTIQTTSDILRGEAEANSELAPAGVVLKATRPRFNWPAAKGARSVVKVFRGDSEVARSPLLETSQWQLERDLERGATYTWNVRIEEGDAMCILPSAPAPLAKFHVIDETALAEIEDAERRHPDAALLIGILQARAGLVSEARESFHRVREPNDVAVARRLLREIDSWKAR